MAAHEPSKRTRIALVVASVILTAMFLAAGVPKLLAAPSFVEGFSRWGLPRWFMYLTGALEVGCAIGLWVPRLRPVAALGLCCVMIGAIVTHLTHGEAGMIGVPVVLFALAAAVAWGRRRELPRAAPHRPRVHA